MVAVSIALPRFHVSMCIYMHRELHHWPAPYLRKQCRGHSAFFIWCCTFIFAIPTHHISSMPCNPVIICWVCLPIKLLDVFCPLQSHLHTICLYTNRWLVTKVMQHLIIHMANHSIISVSLNNLRVADRNGKVDNGDKPCCW